jgi:hypothetical protein
MDSDDPLKKIAEEVLSTPPQKKKPKHNRTLSLDVENFLWLQKHCLDNNYKVSELIDKLIAAYRSSTERTSKVG